MTHARPTSDAPGPGAEPSLFAKVSQALEQIHAVFTDIEALSRAQDELIDRDTGDEVLEHLARRQVLVDRLTELDRDLQPLRERWEAVSGGAPAAQRECVDGRLAAINDVASRVSHRDREAAHRLRQRRDALAEELAGLGRSRGARSAYGPAFPGGGAQFQDREG